MVTHISLVLTWFEELKAMVPGGQAKQAARQRSRFGTHHQWTLRNSRRA